MKIIGLRACQVFVFFVFLISGEIFAGTQYYRLSYRDDPATSIVIGWCEKDTSSNAQVFYGTTDYGTNYLNYPLFNGIDRSVDNFYGLNHRFARLTQLTPNTVYYFVVRDDQGISERMCFKTLPDNADSPVSFIAGGDSRTAMKGEPDSLLCRGWRQDANRLVSKISPDFVTFSGDCVLLGTVARFWPEWFTDWQLTITPEGRLFPLVPTLGNHEASHDVYNMFDVPDSLSYYALSIAGKLLRIYSLNTDLGCDAAHSIVCDSAQRSWLANDLQVHTGNSNEPRWKFAQYHYPFAAHAYYPVNTIMIDCWASLFQTYKINLVAESHAHIIKVTWPIVTSPDAASDSGFIRNDSCGIVYIGEGSWGAPLRDLFTTYSPDAAFRWTRNQEKMPGFQLIYVTKEKIEVRVVKIESVSNVGQVGINDPPGSLPANIVLWEPSNGSVVTIKNHNPLSDNEISTVKTAAIYPNPANSEVLIDFSDKNTTAKVEVYNAYGCSIKSISVPSGNTYSLDISAFKTGIYYFCITMKKFRECYKISVVR